MMSAHTHHKHAFPFSTPYTARRSVEIDTSDSTEFELSVLGSKSLIQEFLTSRGLVRKPGPAIKGTADGFKSQIHDVVPGLEDLTDEDLSIIGESKKFDPDSD